MDFAGLLPITTLDLIDALRNTLELDGLDVTSGPLLYDALISKASARFIGNYDQIPLESRKLMLDLIEQSKILDVMLWITNKRHRDHRDHQFRVGAMGALLLDFAMPESDKTMWQAIAEFKHWSRSDVYFAWWASSLLHDHAYPLSFLVMSLPKFVSISKRYKHTAQDAAKYERILRHFRLVVNEYYQILCPSILTLMDELWQTQRLDRFSRKLGEVVAAGLVKADIPGKSSDILRSDLFDHGVLGATNLIGHLSLSDEQWEQTKYKGIICDIARAIAFHNNVGVNPISFAQDPIAYLLILCDEMQEWDRVFMLPDGDFTELNKIYIGPIEKTVNGLQGLGRKVKIVFPYELNENELKLKTGWDRNDFQKSKLANFNRLHGPFEIIMFTDISTLLVPWARG